MNESDSPSADDNDFDGFAIPIPKGLFASFAAQRAAHEEASSKIRVRYDSILQRFRIKLHTMTEGIDGIDEQLYRLAFARFQKLQSKLLTLSKYPPPVRKAIAASLREILDFVENMPACPICNDGGCEGEHPQQGATVAETEAEYVADSTKETDAARAASYDGVVEGINDEEVFDARMVAAGVKYEFTSPNAVVVHQPSSVDALRVFPSFLAALKLDFPNFSFTTK